MKNKILVGLVGVIAILAVVAAYKVDANALFFLPTTSSSTSTSSPSYLTTSGANATATTTFDAYSNGSPRAANGATILTQYVASSTSSVFTMRVDYSQDGVDWYSDNAVSQQATTTVMNIAANAAYSYTAASTATTSKAVLVKTPTRYMRVVYTIAGAAGAAWTQIVPTREAIQ